MQFELLIKKINNQLAPEEEITFNDWYDSDVNHQEYFNKVRNDYPKNFQPVDSQTAWMSVSSKLSVKKQKPYRRLAIAASIIGLVGLFSFFNYKTSLQELPTEPSIAKTVVEIEDGAVVLTLGNGTDVALTKSGYQNNNISSNGSELIYKEIGETAESNEIVYNYITVPRGGDFFVQLSDGTKVWLNSESKLKFPVTFIGNSRNVELLYGEAYFEVSPSTLHNGKNFVVHSRQQTVEVLGTEFNLKAYNDEEYIITTLIEGKVSLTHDNIAEINALRPSQQATFNSQTKNVDVKTVDVDAIIAWRKGILSFSNASLKDIMQSLSRWYDLDVMYTDESLANQKFNGIFRKTQNIENILMSIEKTQQATFKINGNKVIVENVK